MDMSSASVRGSPWIEVMRQGKGERERDGHTGAVLLAEIEIDAPTVYGETTVCSVGMEERRVTIMGICACLFPEDLFKDIDGS